MFSPPPSSTATEAQQRTSFSTIPSISLTPSSSSSTNNNKIRYNGTPYPSRSHLPHTPRSATTSAAVDTPSSSSPRRIFAYKASPTPPMHNNTTSPGLSSLRSANNANGPTAAPFSSSLSSAGRSHHDIRTSFDVNWNDIGDKGSSSFGLRRRVTTTTPGGLKETAQPTVPEGGGTGAAAGRSGTGTPPPTTSLAFVEPLFAENDMAMTSSITSPSSNTYTATHQSLDPSDNSTISPSHCVIVYGFSPSHRNRILSLFTTYGTILSHYPSCYQYELHDSEDMKTNNNDDDDENSMYNTNWVVIRYKSCLEAENALCQDGTIHVETCGKGGDYYRRVILGVRRWDTELMKQMGLPLDDGSNDGSRGWSNKHLTAAAAVTARDGMSTRGREDSQTYNRVSSPPDITAINYDELYDKDILLNGGKDSVNNAASDLLTSQKHSGDGSICSLILKWIFMW